MGKLYFISERGAGSGSVIKMYRTRGPEEQSPLSGVRSICDQAQRRAGFQGCLVGLLGRQLYSAPVFSYRVLSTRAGSGALQATDQQSAPGGEVNVIICLFSGRRPKA